MDDRLHIAVVTGNRADYGLLRGVISELRRRAQVTLTVTGTHWLPRYGTTWREIEADETPFETIDIALGSDLPSAVAKTVSLGVSGFADAWGRLEPDWVLVLGDRFEIFAAAQAAFFLGIPVAHIGGGDVTRGAFDDSIRHAISKLSSLHFTASDAHRDRLIQMGEAVTSVFTVGSLGVENAEKLAQRRSDFRGTREILLSFHPETNRPHAEWYPILDRLGRALSRHPAYTVVATAPNGDPGSESVLEWIDARCRNCPQFSYVPSFGQRAFLERAVQARAMIGNSSSGVFEIPALGVPFLHLGQRQSGRGFPPGVLHCAAENEADVEAAVERLLSDENQALALRAETPYRGDAPASRIAELLVAHPLPRGKSFVDGGSGAN